MPFSHPTAPVELLPARIAAHAPDSVALEFQGRRVTYGELERRTSQLANALRVRGVGPEVRVGVALERGIDAVVALLAVMKAGGAYVPLDPAYPAARLQHMLADSAAPVLITRAALAAGFPAGPWSVLDIDAERDSLDASPADAPAGPAGPDALAYVIYTSGSTGQPKGVMVGHRGIGGLARTQQAAFGVDAESRVLQVASLSFDASVWEMAMAFFAGATLVLAPREAMLPGEGFITLLRDARITHVTLSPSVLALLPHAELPELRTMVVAGEACPPELVERWSPGRRFFNAYGPTETTVCATMDECAAGAPVRIGRAIDGARVHVLSPELRPVEPGTDGELCVGGAGLARGYHGRPGATAERFVPDAFGGPPGARLYRTGDRVRQGPDGRLEYRGRMDDQVKVRGHRIELGEVESVLRSCPGVAAAVAAAHRTPDGLMTLAAYVVPVDGDVDDATLRAWMAERLPGYMVPSAFVRIPEIPLSPSGKADRARLPHPSSASSVPAGREPRTETERALARIWCEVLAVPAVGADQPFLALGGHSLRVVQVLSRVSGELGAQVPPHVLLRSGTIEEVAALVDANDGSAPEDRVAGRADRGRPIPLSFSQEATWFFEEFAPGLMAYRAQATLRIRGPLEVPALERALAEIVRRHEIFRTTFPVENGSPRQQIHPPFPVRLPVADVPAGPAEERETAVREMARAEFLRPFDTAALPLVRWTLLRLDADDHVMTIVEHHFVHDGWSFGVFLRELRALYLAHLDGGESPLGADPVQFADFAVWQREWLESPAGQDGLRYWEGALAGVPALELPTDFPRPAVMSFRGDAERIRMDPALAARARAFSREHGVTLFVTLQTAFHVLLGRYSGQDDFCTGSGLANRGHPELEGVIGMLVNTVAVRSGLAGDPTGAELLRRVRATTLAAFEHQDVPFDQVVRRIQPERSTSALPVYQVFFSFHDSPMPGLAFGGLDVELAEAQNIGSAKGDMSVIVIPRAEQGVAGFEEEVLISWEYSTDLFERATVLRMAGHFQALLGSLMAEPEQRVSRLALMREAERTAVVAGGHGPQVAVPSTLVHEAFQARAAETPDAVAVVDGRGEVTCAALNARANRIAHALRRRGVGADARVALCLERGAELVVCMLAILKAGGGYVPLDPAYPSERLERMIADSGAAVLLTTRALRGRIAPAAGVDVLEVDDAAAFADQSTENPASGATARSLAYVIYTSGSTGAPKGVGIDHGALVNHMAWFVRDFGVGADDRVLQKTSLSFDAAGWEVFAPLLAGGVLVLAAPGEERDPRSLVRTVRAREITLLQLVPTLFHALLDEPELAECTSLRQVFCGGEALPGELCRRFAALLPHARLVNLYGPTECCIDASTHRVGEADGAAAVAPIGRPVANTRAYVLDGALRPLPVGVPGELYIGGVQVARGYLGRPALTAERFVPDPFAPAPGARLYRTGDRARWLESAEVRECVSAEVSPRSANSRTDALTHSRTAVLEYLGRVDEQVKIRGFRIEPGEVEAVLRSHPAVRECAVLAREDRPGEKRLAAYVGADPDAVGAAELRAHVGASVPEYMVPSAFVFLDALPLTPNGKLDRRALPAPERGASAEAFVAPAEGTEAEVAEIWRDVLGVERVGAHDDFFELGGDSLRGTRVVLRTRELMARDIPLVSLFNHRTLAAFARAAAEAPPVRAVPALSGDPFGDGDEADGASPHRLLAALDDLSEDELNHLLGATS